MVSRRRRLLICVWKDEEKLTYQSGWEVFQVSKRTQTNNSAVNGKTHFECCIILNIWSIRVTVIQ